MKSTYKTKIIFPAIFLMIVGFFAITNIAYAQYAYDDYAGSSWNTSNYSYDDYGWSNYSYDDYGWSNYSYDDYGWSNYSYDDYGWSNYSYDDYGYNNYSYTDYAYTDYLVPDYGYTYTTPSGCTGSYCGNSFNRPINNPRCSGSFCGNNGRNGLNLGLGLNYSDDDTTVTNTTRVNNRIDNSVRITEDNDTTTNTCSNGDGNCNTTTNTHIVYGNGNNGDDDDFDVQCRVSDTSIDEGDTVTFSVDVDGGRSPYDIEWDGDISGDDSSERVRFNRAGRYEVEVTVRDRDGNRASDTCAVVRVGDEDDDNRNVNVVTRTNLGTPTGNLASLDSVFLSQVPYTGPQDVLKALGVLAFIAIWSTGVAVYFKRRRAQRAVASRIADFKAVNKTSATIR